MDDPVGVANRIAKYAGVDEMFTPAVLVDPLTGRERKWLPRQRTNSPWQREPTQFVRREMERAREILDAFYAPLNEQLYALLDQHGIEFKRFAPNDREWE